MKSNDKMGIKGFFSGRLYEARNVLREMEIGDPLGVLAARKDAFVRAMKEGLPSDFERVSVFSNSNTIMLEYYDLVFDSMLKGDAYVENVRMGLFGNDVNPSETLIISTFEASLGEATGYTVDGGSAVNRSTTTFAASASQSITNSAVPSRFTFTGSDTIYGALITQAAPLKDGSGDSSPAVLVAAGKFTAAQPVSNGSIIDVVYTQSKV